LAEQKSFVKARLEAEGLVAEFEGTPEDVASAILKYLAQVYPAISVVKRLVFSPDLAELMERLSEAVSVTEVGTVMLRKEASTEDGIMLVLAGAEVASKLGKRAEPAVSIEELQLTLNVAEKTIRNVCSILVKQGLITRNGRGTYRAAPSGIYHLLIEEESRRRELNHQRLLEAARITDRIRRPSPTWSSTEGIRRWRDKRK